MADGAPSIPHRSSVAGSKARIGLGCGDEAGEAGLARDGHRCRKYAVGSWSGRLPAVEGGDGTQDSRFEVGGIRIDGGRRLWLNRNRRHVGTLGKVRRQDRPRHRRGSHHRRALGVHAGEIGLRLGLELHGARVALGLHSGVELRRLRVHPLREGALAVGELLVDLVEAGDRISVAAIARQGTARAEIGTIRSDADLRERHRGGAAGRARRQGEVRARRRCREGEVRDVAHHAVTLPASPETETRCTLDLTTTCRMVP